MKICKEELKMNFLNKLERRFGRYAIPNLMLYIIIINAAGFVSSLFYPRFLYYTCWSMNAILHGQVWRLVTFIMTPFEEDIFSFLLYALVYYSIGNALERTWGAFRFNLYVFTGLFGHILAGVLVYFLFHVDMLLMSTSYLNMSLFLALAMTYPDTQFLLFFLIPIKAKWMAAVSGIFLAAEFVRGDMTSRVTIIMSLINFILFAFLNRNLANRSNLKDVKRRREFRQKMRQAQYEAARKPMHKCVVCGRTDKDFPDLEFRYCSKCDGAYEYCMEHLYTHVHITKNTQNK